MNWPSWRVNGFSPDLAALRSSSTESCLARSLSSGGITSFLVSHVWVVAVFFNRTDASSLEGRGAPASETIRRSEDMNPGDALELHSYNFSSDSLHSALWGFAEIWLWIYRYTSSTTAVMFPLPVAGDIIPEFVAEPPRNLSLRDIQVSLSAKRACLRSRTPEWKAPLAVRNSRIEPNDGRRDLIWGCLCRELGVRGIVSVP
mmetsp:Transcript_11399/g.21906  ORF Transcript_11399/g.21906 Transcript_11399/m.21906 type:complete len:202 (-) Transcript_11399:33-638(-)